MSKTELGSAKRLNELVALLSKTVDSRVGGDVEKSYTARLIKSLIDRICSFSRARMRL